MKLWWDCVCGLEVFSLSLSLERRRTESAKLYTRWSGAALLRYLYRAPTIRPALILILAFSYARVSVFLQEDERAKGKKARSVRAGRKRWEAIPRKRQTCLWLKAYRFTAIIYTCIYARYITLNIFHTYVAIWSMVGITYSLLLLLFRNFLSSMKDEILNDTVG